MEEDLGVDGDNIKEDLEQTGCEGVDFIRQIQDREKRLLWTRLWSFNFYRMCVHY